MRRVLTTGVVTGLDLRKSQPADLGVTYLVPLAEPRVGHPNSRPLRKVRIADAGWPSPTGPAQLRPRVLVRLSLLDQFCSTAM